MKNSVIIYIFFLVFLSCKNDEKQYATFSGTIKNTNEPVIKVVDYNHSYDKDISIDESGKFSDTISILKSGTYFFQVGSKYSTFHLKNGYNLNLKVNMKDFYNTISFTGEGSDVNNFNISRKKLKGKLIGVSKDFFLVPLDSFLLKTDNNRKDFLKLLDNSGIKGNDKTIQEKIIEYDYILTRNNYDKFVYYHTKKHPKLPLDYYDPIKKINIDDEESYCYSKSYRTLLGENFRLTYKDALKENPDLSIIDFTKDKISNVKSVLIKDQFISMLFRQINSKNPNLESDYKTVLELLTSKRFKDKLTKRYNALKSSKPSMKAKGFEYENFKGGKTSLNDLKGKLVYIDIWASWCGPCKREIPYLEKLIHKYKGNNIEFVSISVDSKKDHDKWKKMVTEKDLKGIQLFADNSFKSDFIKFYNVNLIPRYFLIDEKGDIISAQAPRPSDKNTPKVLDSLLLKMKQLKH
jgi:thiol-disulfide isomerase/thioredoxin